MEDLFDGSRQDSLRLQMLGWGDKLSAVFNAAIELGYSPRYPRERTPYPT